MKAIQLNPTACPSENQVLHHLAQNSKVNFLEVLQTMRVSSVADVAVVRFHHQMIAIQSDVLYPQPSASQEYHLQFPPVVATPTEPLCHQIGAKWSLRYQKQCEQNAPEHSSSHCGAALQLHHPLR